MKFLKILEIFIWELQVWFAFWNFNLLKNSQLNSIEKKILKKIKKWKLKKKPAQLNEIENIHVIIKKWIIVAITPLFIITLNPLR